MTYWSLLVVTLFLGVAQEGTVTLYHSGSFVGYGRVVGISRDEQAAALDLDLDDTPDLCLPVRRLHPAVDDVGTIPGIGSVAAFSVEGRRHTGRVIGLDRDVATVTYVLGQKRYKKQIPIGKLDGCLTAARDIGRGEVVPPRNWHFRSGKTLANMSFLDCDEENLSLLPARETNQGHPKLRRPPVGWPKQAASLSSEDDPVRDSQIWL